MNSLTPSELSHLIRSLYQESSHRTRFLTLINQATGTYNHTSDDRVRLRDVIANATTSNLNAAANVIQAKALPFLSKAIHKIGAASGTRA